MSEDFIVYVYPHLLRSSLLAWFIAVIWKGRILSETIRGLACRKTLCGLTVLTLFALALRLWVIPHTHHVFYDELKHLDLARNLARNGSFGETLAGGQGGFDWMRVPAYWPAGFHTLLSLVFMVFGFSETAAYGLNAFLGALSVPLLFFVSLLLWKDEAAALSSASILCFLPVHLKFSGCADLSVNSFFWMTASILAFLIYRERRIGGTLTLWLITLAYAVHCRPENLILGLLLAVWDLWGRRAALARRDLRSAWLLVPIIAAAPVLLLVVANSDIFVKVFGENLGGLWKNLRANGPDNLGYFFDSLSQGALMGLAFAGLFWSLPLDRSAAVFWAAFSGAFFLIYSLFLFGNFTQWDWPAAPDRYSLVLYIPILAFAGLGISRLSRSCQKPKTAAVLACAGLFVLGIPTYNQMFDSGLDQEDRYRFLMDSAGLLPKDAYVITFLPGAIVALTGRPAVSSELMLNERPALEAAIIRDSGRRPQYVLFKDFWWFQPWRPAEELERVLLKDYVLSPILERQVGDRAFGFYRLTPRVDAPPGQARGIISSK